ncbi:hypothetical protein NCPPB3923_26865 [Burkholderia glumae]|nr:hypothetical protein NCPPB3923_26865 [Burkholderia glumae]
MSLQHVRSRMVSRLRNVDESLAQRVADGLAIALPDAAPPAREPIDMKPSPALSIVANAKPTLRGRKVGILFDEGSDKAAIEALVASIEKAGGRAMLIAPKVGGVPVQGGTLTAHGQLAGSPSVLVDAVALALTEDAARKLAQDAAALSFVLDAFAHLKAIGHTPGAQPLLERAGIQPDAGVTDLGEAFVKAAARRFYDREPKLRELA